MKRVTTGRRTRPIDERYHSQMKVLVEDVALWRLVAADRALPHGWIEAAAAARGVSASAVTMAIGGQTWSQMIEPPPVPPKARWAPRVARQRRPLCPTCGRRKYVRDACRDTFHQIDHRTTRYQAAKKKRTSAARR